MLRLTVIYLLTNSLFLHTDLAQNDIQLVLYHTSNIKSRFEETKVSKDGKPIGGCARIAHVINEARLAHAAGKGPPVLYLDSGDLYTGSIWFTVYKSKIAAKIMNALKPTAMCVGNHEFDFGIEELFPFLTQVKFPVLASSLSYGGTNLEKLLHETVIVTIKEFKIGIISYLITASHEMSDLGIIKIKDEVTEIRRLSKQLTDQGVKTIIALGHSTYRIDKRIAKFVEDVDLVVGSHSNIFQWNGKEPDLEKRHDPYPKIIRQKNGKVVPVVTAYAFAKYIGKLIITFDRNGSLKTFSGQPIFLNETVPQHSSVLNILEKFRPAIAKINTTAVGNSKVLLDATNCRKGECNLGNLVLDAFVKYRASRYNGSGWTDAAVALMNAGAVNGMINASLRENIVYKSDILTTLPYRQLLYIIALRGRDLVKLFEVSALKTNEGGFLLVSGLKVILDLEDFPLKRVKSILVKCASCDVPTYSPIQNETVYKIVTIEYLAKGRDGYGMIPRETRVSILVNVYYDQAVVEYIKTMVVIMPEMDGRISTDYNTFNGIMAETPQCMLSFFLATFIFCF